MYSVIWSLVFSMLYCTFHSPYAIESQPKSQSPHTKPSFELWGLTHTEMPDELSVHLLWCVSVCACVHVCVCACERSRGGKHSFKSTWAIQEKILLDILANILKYSEETNLVCICSYLFLKVSFHNEYAYLPQQCKPTPAEPQPCLNYCNTFFCLVNNYLLPRLDQESGNRELWLIKNFKN